VDQPPASFASNAITLKLHATLADTKASIEALLKREAAVLTVITLYLEVANWSGRSCS